eukprot:1574575-Pyramimonas_sp.AAC.2
MEAAKPAVAKQDKNHHQEHISDYTVIFIVDRRRLAKMSRQANDKGCRQDVVDKRILGQARATVEEPARGMPHETCTENYSLLYNVALAIEHD